MFFRSLMIFVYISVATQFINAQFVSTNNKSTGAKEVKTKDGRVVYDMKDTTWFRLFTKNLLIPRVGWAVTQSNGMVTVDDTGKIAPMLISNLVLNKSQVGLSNVDNTSDMNKPVSTAQEVAIALRQNQLNGTGFVKATGTNISYDNSTYYLASNPNNYINQSGARSAISLTTTGSGSASYSSSTGVLNIPVAPTVSGATGTYGQTTVSNGLVASGKRIEHYTGTTDVNGNYSVTFSVAYSTTPTIQAQLIGGNDLTFFRVTSRTTTGFNVYCFSRASITSLPILGVLTSALLGSAATPVQNATFDVTIQEK